MRTIQPKIISPMDVPMASEGSRKIYPHFEIEMRHLPEAKKWDLKKKYKVVLELEMISKSINERDDGKEFGYAGFDITGIEVVDNNKKPFKVLYKE